MSMSGSRSNNKKLQRPKRPLSAYNLFYRFKRDKILRARANGDDSIETIHELIAAVPGLEDYPSIAKTMSPQQIDELRRTEIRTAMLENISPKDHRHRSHRKKTGASLSFLEMSNLMVASWKSTDDFTRDVFEELAEVGRKMYRKRVAEYQDNYPVRIMKLSNFVSLPTAHHPQHSQQHPQHPQQHPLQHPQQHPLQHQLHRGIPNHHPPNVVLSLHPREHAGNLPPNLPPPIPPLISPNMSPVTAPSTSRTTYFMNPAENSILHMTPPSNNESRNHNHHPSVAPPLSSAFPLRDMTPSPFDGLDPEPLDTEPISSSIFDLEEKRNDDCMSNRDTATLGTSNSTSMTEMNYVSDSSSSDGGRISRSSSIFSGQSLHEFMVGNDSLRLPFPGEEQKKRCSSDVSINDFMEFIATLDERLSK